MLEVYAAYIQSYRQQKLLCRSFYSVSSVPIFAHSEREMTAALQFTLHGHPRKKHQLQPVHGTPKPAAH